MNYFLMPKAVNFISLMSSKNIKHSVFFFFLSKGTNLLTTETIPMYIIPEMYYIIQGAYHLSLSQHGVGYRRCMIYTINME